MQLVNNPKITVITVCFNAVCDIEDTLLSVINQTYSNIDYIVVDGASKDGTVEVVSKYKNHIAQIISEPDEGIYDAMNKGILNATGEWIIFRNVGDPFSSNKVVETIFREPVNKDICFILGDSYLFNEWGYKRIKPDILEYSYKQRMPVIHPATFIRTSLHKKRLFDLKYKSSADYDFFYKCFEEGCKFEYKPIVVADFNSVGFSTINWKRAYMENGEITGADTNKVRFLAKYYYTAIRAFIGEEIIMKIPLLRNQKYNKMRRQGWKNLPIVKE